METLSDRKYDMVVITGPTASGKTSLAAAVASRTGGEIISADSRQVYRRMDLGTGKDYDDYVVNGVRIPCHLIDVAEPGHKYNLFEFQRDFTEACSDLKKRSVFPVVCGGSGMYVDCIVSGYSLREVPPDPVLREKLAGKSLEELATMLRSYKRLHNTTDIDTKKRAIRAIEIERYQLKAEGRMTTIPGFRPLIAGILYDRQKRRERITERLRQRLDAGLADEVQGLLDNGLKPEDLIYYGLEYKYVTLYLTGKLKFDEMFRSLEIAIHQYAKRQMTWFRGMERRGIKINWIGGELPFEEKAEYILRLLAGNE